MQRMNREKRGDKSASPQPARHAVQHEKQEDDSNRVQKNVGKMVRACL